MNKKPLIEPYSDLLPCNWSPENPRACTAHQSYRQDTSQCKCLVAQEAHAHACEHRNTPVLCASCGSKYVLSNMFHDDLYHPGYHCVSCVAENKDGTYPDEWVTSAERDQTSTAKIAAE